MSVVPISNHDDCDGEYLQLIYAFPLRPIRNEVERKAAGEVLDMLLNRDQLGDGPSDYLDVLSDLIEKYDHEHHFIEPLPDHQVLAQLLADNRMSQSEFGSETGISSSTVSEIINGTRRFTRSQLGRVAERFKVSPSLFRFEGE